MVKESLDSFGVRSILKVNGGELDFFSLRALESQGLADLGRLPYSLKILLENLLRNEDGEAVTREDIKALANWNPDQESDREIAFTPARVILQDFTGVPAVVDLAVMRDAMDEMGGDPTKINPLVPAELVIDHSVQVDSFGTPESFRINVEKEFSRNLERYKFLRWGQSTFDNLRVVPPATGIVHQVNLEYLARVVFKIQKGDSILTYPDTVVGTDSHTTMINGLGVLGWGVGGIEAEAAMLGQPISLLIPQVVGFKLIGTLPEGATATDLVLTITRTMRETGVVGKFVEFYGPGVSNLSLADRATLGNMSPEYGATCSMFPIDQETLEYLRFTARDPEHLELVESYARAQGLFQTKESSEVAYSECLELDLQSVKPSLAGPKRPQDLILLSQAKQTFEQGLSEMSTAAGGADGGSVRVKIGISDTGAAGQEFELHHGAVVIASITSCTNTSNPSVMIGAGLLARNAIRLGLRRQPWVKTSLAPGSKVVTEYLQEAGLSSFLSQLGFDLVGYGCTTCIGNSGPLSEEISQAISKQNLVVCSVLSGNRNFEGRINPHVRANYLASPPLVVAYALAGRMDIDLYTEPLGQAPDGKDIYLKDVWPAQEEIRATVRQAVRSEMFSAKYADLFSGDDRWQSLEIPKGDRYDWGMDSTYIKQPPFFKDMSREPEPIKEIKGLRVLAMLGDSVTTDHISPAGSIPRDSPAGCYLIDRNVTPEEFNSFGSRRGNHEVMMRGTFGNIRLRNLLAPETEGGYTIHPSFSEPISIYEAAVRYMEEGVPLLVIGGRDYGAGSSRDWAAKGTRLLGIRAVLAESFERIHRSNLIGMGVLPLQFEEGQNREVLNLTGSETYDLQGLENDLRPGKKITVHTMSEDGEKKSFAVVLRIDTPNEVTYYRHGGILHYVLRSLLDS